MYAEFYNLRGKPGPGVTAEDDGIIFKVTNVSLCGDTLRLELGKDRWYFVRGNPEEGFIFFGREFSDFGMKDKPFSAFTRISMAEAREHMISQDATRKELDEDEKRWKQDEKRAIQWMRNN